MRKIMSCGVLIVRGDPVEQFLIMEHKKRLDLPKGHVDSGETELECALRELVEETAIDAQDIELVDGFRFEHRYFVRPKRFNKEKCEKTLVVFMARLVRDVNIVVTEHEGYRWVDWNPPHKIQEQTIDPLLEHAESFLRERT